MADVLAITNYDDIRQLRENLFAKISNRCHVLTKTLQKVEGIESYEAGRDIVEGLACIEALNYMKSGTIILDTILYAFIDACYQTKEYNYDLYIERLTSAIRANYNEIVFLSSDGKNVSFRINLDPLGDITEWAAAVEATREALGIGKVAERDMAMASHMWMEKIYKTGREGRTIHRTKKVKGEGGKSETSMVDVTEKYVMKYRQTIEMRLSLIPSNHAPFWYLIVHGNADAPFGEGGTPYPNVTPSNVIQEIDRTLTQVYEMAYTTYLAKADKYLTKVLAESFTNSSDMINTSIRNIREMNSYFENRAYDMLMANRALTEERSKAIENTMQDIERVLITVKGKTVVRLRDVRTKRFI
jgi:hypothetical protein